MLSKFKVKFLLFSFFIQINLQFLSALNDVNEHLFSCEPTSKKGMPMKVA